MWVRGLKQLILITHHILTNVAPYVGAWIETDFSGGFTQLTLVAPYVGAWIETHTAPFVARPLSVAPYVGAWIETNTR